MFWNWDVCVLFCFFFWPHEMKKLDRVLMFDTWKIATFPCKNRYEKWRRNEIIYKMKSYFKSRVGRNFWNADSNWMKIAMAWVKSKNIHRFSTHNVYQKAWWCAFSLSLTSINKPHNVMKLNWKKYFLVFDFYTYFVLYTFWTNFIKYT